MEGAVFTPFKGIAFLLALSLLLYPGILLLQVLTGTITESISQIIVLFGLSLVVWSWVFHLYRDGEFTGVQMAESE